MPEFYTTKNKKKFLSEYFRERKKPATVVKICRRSSQNILITCNLVPYNKRKKFFFINPTPGNSD